MNTYISPNDTQRTTDSESIRAAIALAVESGSGRVRIPRLNERTGEALWVIDSAIALPSNIEILIDGAHLMLADGCYCNMFTCGDPKAKNGRKACGETKNVTVRGRGNAILDGGKYNGLSEKNHSQNGLPHIFNNTTMLFFNTSNLLVEDLNIINQRWWAITNVFVHHATYRNIRFRADISRIDENGVHHPDELPTRYREIYVKNADGIDLRIGCHDFLIENISGRTEDDSIALTALGEWEKKNGYVVEGASTDIHDVVIKNVSTDAYICSNVRLLNDEGNKLYNVLIDGVTSLHEREEYRCKATVRIGDTVYAKTDSSVGDTYNVTVRNVISTATNAVTVCKGLVDSTIENVTVLEGEAGIRAIPFATLKNCKIKHVLPIADGSVSFIEDGFTLENTEMEL